MEENLLKKYIYCKTLEKGKQSFYVVFEGKEYYLFSQSFRRSNKEVFGNKVYLSEFRMLKKHHSHSVRFTIEKLYSHIRYIEKEYNICLLDKSQESKKKYYIYPNCRYNYELDFA